MSLLHKKPAQAAAFFVRKARVRVTEIVFFQYKKKKTNSMV
jgi:hypothetical protein